MYVLGEHGVSVGAVAGGSDTMLVINCEKCGRRIEGERHYYVNGVGRVCVCAECYRRKMGVMSGDDE